MKKTLALTLLLMFLVGSGRLSAQPRAPRSSKAKPAAPATGLLRYTAADSLLIAAATNNVPLAARLLAHGTRPNQRYALPDSAALDDWNQEYSVPMGLFLPNWEYVEPHDAALHVAVRYGYLAMAEYLLRHGADANLPGRFNMSPLVLALESIPHQRAMLKLLLKHGARPDYEGPNQVSLVHLVVGLNNRGQYQRRNRYRQAGRAYYRPTGLAQPDSVKLAILRLLVEAGAPPDRKSDLQQTPLHLAALSGQVALAQYLATHGAAINARDRTGATPLHLAGDSTAMAQLLLAQGAHVNAFDSVGRTALHMAAQAGHLAVMKLLLRAGAEVNGRRIVVSQQVIQTYSHGEGWQIGATPLHAAAFAGRVKAVRVLLEAGALVDACNQQDDTALQLAIRASKMDGWGEPTRPPVDSAGETDAPAAQAVVRLLLAHGADATLANQDGITPLHTAVANDDSTQVAWLLAHHASPNRPAYDEHTPVAAVRSLGIMRQLLAHGARLNEPYSSPLLYPYTLGLDLAQACLAAGARLTVVNEEYETPLHLAAKRDVSIELLRLYLSRGAPIEAVDSTGQTPLAEAIAAGSPEKTELFLAAGASVSGRAGVTRPPLMLAVMRADEQVIQTLLAHGAQPNEADGDGNTALLVAVGTEYMPTTVVQLLLAAGANPNAQNKAGFSPLHWLIKQGNETRGRQAGWGEPNELASCRLQTAAQLLLDAGARPDSRNSQGESIQNDLQRQPCSDNAELLALLHRKGLGGK